jgi:hypothetical protein
MESVELLGMLMNDLLLKITFCKKIIHFSIVMPVTADQMPMLAIAVRKI